MFVASIKFWVCSKTLGNKVQESEKLHNLNRTESGVTPPPHFEIATRTWQKSLEIVCPLVWCLGAGCWILASWGCSLALEAYKKWCVHNPSSNEYQQNKITGTWNDMYVKLKSSQCWTAVLLIMLEVPGVMPCAMRFNVSSPSFLPSTLSTPLRPPPASLPACLPTSLAFAVTYRWCVQGMAVNLSLNWKAFQFRVYMNCPPKHYFPTKFKLLRSASFLLALCKIIIVMISRRWHLGGKFTAFVN